LPRHRNWIVVADAAYPAQAAAGIETVLTGVSQTKILAAVAQAIAESAHARARIFVDRELDFIQEQDAPGIERYKQDLAALLAASNLQRLPHEQIIANLDRAAQLFRILILKTSMTIPYTSVFFELDCGYWDDPSEHRLRHAITLSES